MADPILKMAGLKLFFDNCFIRKWFLKSGYQCWMPQTISKVKDDFEVINQLIYIVPGYYELFQCQESSNIVKIKDK